MLVVNVTLLTFYIVEAVTRADGMVELRARGARVDGAGNGVQELCRLASDRL